MTQHKKTQNFFFLLFDKFSKISVIEGFFQEFAKKKFAKNFFEIFFLMKIYQVRKNIFCVFLCCVILCHLKDTCVVSFDRHNMTQHWTV